MKITTIGEVLIDMTEIGRDENGIPRFQANPGGAPANVAVAVSKLGGEAGFIGCVGEDAFGAFLRETLVRCGVDVHGLQIARDASTTLAVVTVDEKGERSFSFCRKPGADTRIDPDKAKKIASGADILHSAGTPSSGWSRPPSEAAPSSPTIPTTGQPSGRTKKRPRPSSGPCCPFATS